MPGIPGAELIQYHGLYKAGSIVPQQRMEQRKIFQGRCDERVG